MKNLDYSEYAATQEKIEKGIRDHAKMGGCKWSIR